MCVIIIKQKQKMMSREIAKTSARINPHGLGIVWLDTFEVTYHKSKDYNVLLTERPFIAHFRYATVGAINKDNTHPFQCGKNKDEWLMMNGTIHGMGNAQMCDSKVLAIALGQMPRQTWKKELSKYECRFVAVNTRNRSFQIFNKHLYTYKDGIWYSKANVLQENLVAVYGTLKKGYSNYNTYLRNAKYVGSGVTKDKYPLVINGLPYMVDKKGVGHNVEVDVFKVSNASFKSIDRLEGHPKWYRRKEIPIKLKSGKELTCWLYFNPQEVTEHTEMHESYNQNYFLKYGLPSSNTYTKIEPTCTQYNMWDVPLDTFRDDEVADEQEETHECGFCFQELQHDDTIDQYHCSGCGDWYTKNEVKRFNIF